ncbi:hypothetical protein U1Q18_034158, partial [Sarracenia purpurea var. burkii]
FTYKYKDAFLQVIRNVQIMYWTKVIHTKRSSEVVVFFKSITETPFKALEIVGTSTESKSASGITGKSNSIKKQSCASPFSSFKESICLASGTLLAVNTPDIVKNSIMVAFTKPDENRKCEAAKVA